MAKAKTVFFCKECGQESSKWLGQCPGCKEWNTFVEESVVKKSVSGAPLRGKKVEPARLSEVSATESTRTKIGIGEFDRYWWEETLVLESLRYFYRCVRIWWNLTKKYYTFRGKSLCAR